METSILVRPIVLGKKTAANGAVTWPRAIVKRAFRISCNWDEDTANKIPAKDYVDTAIPGMVSVDVTPTPRIRINSFSAIAVDPKLITSANSGTYPPWYVLNTWAAAINKIWNQKDGGNSVVSKLIPIAPGTDLSKINTLVD